MSNEHVHEEEDQVVSIAAQMLVEETAEHTAVISDDRPGIHLELVDLSNGISAEDEADEWDFDLPADKGLKILIGGLDPEIAAQLLRVAAEFLEEAIEEGDEDED
ncbi:hypothetical protein [Nocardioides yefusunii]|uniref:Uncharacterized protein n=1 Tax=Nocardioides yefusunii TaxID=2500546 RepID=A0ABW1QWD1_9ACTN|nr:hypothetical protein [Nocardioides yefusunii]